MIKRHLLFTIITLSFISLFTEAQAQIRFNSTGFSYIFLDEELQGNFKIDGLIVDPAVTTYELIESKVSGSFQLRKNSGGDELWFQGTDAKQQISFENQVDEITHLVSLDFKINGDQYNVVSLRIFVQDINDDPEFVYIDTVERGWHYVPVESSLSSEYPYKNRSLFIDEDKKPGEAFFYLNTADEDTNNVITTFSYSFANTIPPAAGNQYFRIDGNKLVLDGNLSYTGVATSKLNFAIEVVDNNDSLRIPTLHYTLPDIDGKFHVISNPTLTIRNVNVAPDDIVLVDSSGNITSIAIVENVDSVIFLGFLKAIDRDPEDLHKFKFDTLPSVVESNAHFNITSPYSYDNTDDAIFSVRKFNYEASGDHKYYFTITATDNGTYPTDKKTLSYTKAFPVTIIDVNEQPTLLDTTIVIDENVFSNSLVIDLLKAVIDEDQGQVYSFTALTEAGPFATGGNGKVLVQDSTALNFEIAKTFAISFKVTDNGSSLGRGNVDLSDEGLLTINIRNVNEAPEVTSGSLFSVLENSPSGTVIDTVLAIDPDNELVELQKLSFAITKGDSSNIFAIDSVTGILTVLIQDSLDYESHNSFELEVTVTDDGKMGSDPDQTPVSSVVKLTINILNKNEPPVITNAGEVFLIQENSPSGTELDSIHAFDSDGQALTFSIIEGNELNVFRLVKGANDSTVVLAIDQPTGLNFETTPTFTLKVVVDDNNSALPPGTPERDTAIFTVNLLDANDYPQYLGLDTTGAVNPLPENATVGTYVGQVKATDEDMAAHGQQLTYSLTAFDTAFYLVDDKLYVFDSDGLDYERDLANPFHRFTVLIKDDAAGFGTTDTLITTTADSVLLADVNEPPLFDTSDANLKKRVSEEAAVDTEVGLVFAFDQDINEVLDFSIVEQSVPDAFYIAPKLNSNGQVNGLIAVLYVKTSAALDRELYKHVFVKLVATDGEFTDTAIIDVEIIDKNDQPSIDTKSVTIGEDQKATIPFSQKIIGKANDEGQSVKYYIVDTDGDQLVFGIQESDGYMYINDGAAVNFETQSTYNVLVKVVDNGLPILDSTQTVIINVEDRNDAPVILDTTYVDINEHPDYDPSVDKMILMGWDDDFWNTDSLSFEFVLGSDPNGIFELVGSDYKSASIVVTNAEALDYEKKDTYTFQVKVTDKLGLTDVSTVTIKLIDKNDAPVIKAQSFSIKENLKQNAVVGQVVATDEDTKSEWNTLVYSIINQTPSSVFDVSNSGLITVADSAALDFESIGSIVTLTVQVTDGIEIRSAEVVVNVEDANDPPVIENVKDYELSVQEESTLTISVFDLVQLFDISDQDISDDFTTDPTSFSIHILSPEGRFYSIVTDSSITPVADYYGELYVLVKVADNEGLLSTSVDSIKVNVINVNDAPVFKSAASDQQTLSLLQQDEESVFELLTSNILIVDPDKYNNSDPAQIYEHNPTIIKVVAGKGYSFSGNTISLLQPDPDSNTSLDMVTVNFHVYDSEGMVSVVNGTIDISVNPINDAPVLLGTKGEIQIDEEAEYQIKQSVLDIQDSDNDPKSSNFGIKVAAGNNYTLVDNQTIKVDQDFFGTLFVLVTVDDGESENSLSQVRNLEIKVVNINDAPTNLSQAKALEINEGESLLIDLNSVVFDDPDDITGFDIQVEDGSNYTRSGNTITPRGDFPNTYYNANKVLINTLTVPVTITDGKANSEVFNLSVTVNNVNDAPLGTGTTLSINAPTDIPEDSDLEITKGMFILAMADIDNSADQLTVSVLDGNNYTHVGNTITPFPNYTGYLVFNVLYSDGEAQKTVNGAFAIEVLPINDAPILTGVNGGSLSTGEDEPITLKLEQFIWSDPDNAAASISLVVRDSANYTIKPDGVTIVPDANFQGVIYVPVSLTDGTDKSAEIIVVVQVTNVADLPVITAQKAIEIDEETSVHITIGDNITVFDADGIEPDSFTLNIASGTDWVVSGSNIIPRQNFAGTLSIPITVTDNQGFTSNIWSFAVTVLNVNDQPVITNTVKGLEMAEDQSFDLLISHLTIDDKGDGDQASFQLMVGAGDNYTAVGNRIFPNENYYGNLSIPVRVNDGNLVSESAILNINVTPVNDAPYGAVPSRILSMKEGGALALTINDFNVQDYDLDDKSFILNVVSGAGYTVVNNIVTTIDPNFYGTLSVKFTIDDTNTNGISGEFAATVIVENVNDAPLSEGAYIVENPHPDSFKEGQSFEVTKSFFNLSNADIDNLSEDLAVQVVDDPDGKYLHAGNVLQVSDPDFSGFIVVRYRLYDGELYSAVQSMGIEVLGVNDAPVFNSTVITLTTQEDVGLPLSVDQFYPGSLNDTDNSKADLTIQLLDGIGYSVGANNTVIPDPDFSGELTVRVTAKDKDGAVSNEYGFKLQVLPVNDAPVIIGNRKMFTLEETPLIITRDSITYTDIDDSKSNIKMGRILAGSGYTVTGINEITPNLNVTGNITVQITVTDDDGLESAPYNMVVNVENVNDKPVILTTSAITIAEDGAREVLLSDMSVTDPDGDLIYVDILDDSNSSPFYTHDGNIVRPKADYIGTVDVRVRVYDGKVFSDEAIIQVIVIDANDVPYAITAKNGKLTKFEDTPFSIQLSDLVISDKDPAPYSYQLIVLNDDKAIPTYTLTGTTISTPKDFVGNIVVGVQINDVGQLSQVFKIPVSILNTNDAPNIVAQKPISILDGGNYEIKLSDLRVLDVDENDNYPTGYSIGFEDNSINYSRSGNTIIPKTGYVGRLVVQLSVKDAQSAYSNVFDFEIAVGEYPYILSQSVVPTVDEEQSINLSLADFLVPATDIKDTGTANYAYSLVVSELGGGDYTVTNNLLTPKDNVYGNIEVLIQVTDGTRTSPPFMATVTVNNVNDAPYFVNKESIDIVEQEDVPFSLPANLATTNVLDPDPTATLSITPIAGRNYTVLNGIITTDRDFFGELIVNVQLTDGELTAQDSIVVRVLNVNDAPVIADGVVVSGGTEELAFKLTLKGIGEFSISDPDRDLIFPTDYYMEVVSVGNGGTYLGSGTIQPAVDFYGNLPVTVKVFDGQLFSDEKEIFVNFANVNDKPEVLVITSKEYDEEENFEIGVGPGKDILNMRDPDHVSFTPSSYTILPVDGDGYSVLNETIVVPDINRTGILLVSYSIKDMDTVFYDNSWVFPVYLNDINEKPEITEVSVSPVNEDGSFELVWYPGGSTPQNMTIMDADNAVTKTSHTLILGSGTNYTVSGNVITPRPDFYGDLNVTLRVDDGATKVNISDPFSFTVTIVPVNDAPSIVARNPIAIFEDSSLDLVIDSLQVDDIDDDSKYPFDYSVKVIDGDNYSVSGTTIIPDANFVGQLQVPVKVVENKAINNTSAIYNLWVDVKAVNDAPELLAQTQTPRTSEETAITLDYASFLTIRDVDAEDSNLTISLLEGKNYVFQGNVLTPTLDFTGVLNVNATVSDGKVSTAIKFKVQVDNINDVPVIVGTKTTLQVVEDGSLTIQLTDLSIKDVDGDNVDLFTLELMPSTNGAYTFNANTVNPVKDLFGQIGVNVRVTDNNGGVSDVKRISLTVTPVNDTPIVSGNNGSSEVYIGEQLTLDLNSVVYTDVDNTSAELSLVVLSGTGYNIVSGNTITSTLTSPGDILVNVKVVDNLGAEGSGTLTVNVLKNLFVQKGVIITNEEQAITLSISQHITIDGGDAGFTMLVLDGLNYKNVGNNEILPATNFYGELTVPVRMINGTDEYPFTLKVAVNNVNDAPVIVGQTVVVTTEEHDKLISLANLSIVDADGDASFTLAVLTGDHYTVSGTTITPEVDFNGYLAVPVTVDDSNIGGVSEAYMLSVEVTDVNDKPVVIGNSYLSVADGQFLDIQLSNLIVTDVDDVYPTEFTLFVQDGPGYTRSGNRISPTASGTITVPIQVKDKAVRSDVYQLQVEVIPSGTILPVITNQLQLSVNEDASLSLNATDFEVDESYNHGYSLVVQAGENYQVSGNTITPKANFEGGLAVPVYVTDGNLPSTSYQAYVSVIGVNDAPIIKSQTYLSVVQGQMLSVSKQHLVVEDVDNVYPEGFSLDVQAGANYTVNGSSIVPNGDFVGLLTVPVSVKDGNAVSNTYSLQVNVVSTGSNLPVIVGQDGISSVEDAAFQLSLSQLTVVDNKYVYPTDFTLSIQEGNNYVRLGDGKILPNKDFFGTLTVPVVVSNPELSSSSYNLVVAVDGVNDAPVIVAQKAIKIDEDKAFVFSSKFLDVSDVDGDTDFTVSIGSGSNFSVSGNVITPALDYNGSLSVPITVQDASLSSKPFVAQIYVGAINDLPEIVAQSAITTVEEMAKALDLSMFTVIDPDNRATDLSLQLVDGVNYSVNGTTVIPTTNFVGDLKVKARVSDGIGFGPYYEAALTVTNTNDAPVLVAQIVDIITDEDVAIEIKTSAFEIVDPDDVVQQIELQQGSFTNYAVSGNHVIPAKDFTGDLVIPVKVRDASGALSNELNAIVSVNDVNDPPVIDGQVYLATEVNTPITIDYKDLLVTDPDGNYPSTDYQIAFIGGANYSVSGTTITPSIGFVNGYLNITTYVNDGEATSITPFVLKVFVSPVGGLPVITTVANPIQILEEASYTLALSDLQATASRGTYPTDYVLTVQDGYNYTKSATTITPVTDFAGDLFVAVHVCLDRTKFRDADTSTTFYVPIDVVNVNDAPEIVSQKQVSALEDESRQITLDDLNVYDPDNEYPNDFSLSVELGANYTVSGTTVQPDADFVGELTIPIRVNDGQEDSNPVYPFKMKVKPVNDAPVILSAKAFTTDEEMPLIIQLSDLSVSDVDNTYPDGFAPVKIANGIGYTSEGNQLIPSKDVSGPLAVNLVVDDNRSENNFSSPFAAILTVNNINDAPVVLGDYGFVTQMNVPLTVDIADFVVTDVDNLLSDLSIASIVSGLNYTVNGLTITPASNFVGNLTVPIVVTDGDLSTTYQATIIVEGNQVPVILSTAPLTVKENSSVSVNLFHLNVQDDNVFPDDFKLTLDNGSNHTVIGNVVSPNVGFIGQLAVPVTVSDGIATSAPKDLTITVVDQNTVIPMITGQKPITIKQGESVNLTSSSVIVSDIDYPTGYTFTVYQGTNYDLDGNRITPKTGYSGALTVPVMVSLDGISSIPYLLKVQVLEEISAPVISQQVVLNISQGKSLNVLFDYLAVSDADNSYPDDFTLTLSSGSNYSKTETVVLPDSKFTGMLEVPVRVHDGTTYSNTWPLAITVWDKSVVIPEITGQQALSIPEEGSKLLSLTDLVFNQEAAKTYNLIVYDGSNYKRSGYTIIANEDFNGMLRVPVALHDGVMISLPFVVEIEVTPVNDAPLVTDQSILNMLENSVAEPSSIVLMPYNLVVSDPDNDYPDGFVLDIPSHTPINYGFTGTTVTPALGFVGDLFVPVKVSDPSGSSSNTYNVQISVLPEGTDFPEIIDNAPLSTNEEQALELKVEYLTIKGYTGNPNDYSLILQEGVNYIINDQSIVPAKDFVGKLTVPVAVNNGLFTGNTYALEIDVVNVNDAPKVLAQSTIRTDEETPVTVSISQLVIEDVDSKVFSLGFEPNANSNYVLSGAATIQPAVDFVGTLTVPIYVLDDGKAKSATYYLQIQVDEKNDAPVVTGQVPLMVQEDSSIKLELDQLTIVDDNDPADWLLVIYSGTNYTVQGNTLIPDANYAGELTVRIRVSDGIEIGDPYNLTVTVQGVNDAPVIFTQYAVNTPEEVAREIVLSDLDYVDIDNPVGDLSIMASAGHGYTVNSLNRILPDPNVIGQLTVPVVLWDGADSSAVFNLLVTVEDVNDKAVIVKQVPLFTAHNTGLAVSLNHLVVTDDNEYPSEFSLGVDPGTGYTLNDNIVVPNAVDVNTRSLIVPISVTDIGGLSSDVFPLQITVYGSGVVVPQILGQQSLSTAVNVPFTIKQEHLFVSGAGYPTGYTINVYEGSSYSVTGLQVTPSTDFVGTLQIPVSVTDPSSITSPIYLVTINVVPGIQKPVITGQNYLQILSGGSLNLNLQDLIVNDDNVYPDDFTLLVKDGVSYTRNGSTIKPIDGFEGELSVGVQVNDGTFLSNVYALKVNVLNPPPFPPVIDGQKVLLTPEETALDLKVSDITIKGVVNNSAYALVVQNGNGYTHIGNSVIPAADFVGELMVPVFVQHKVSLLKSSTFKLKVTVTPVNDAPVIVGQTALSVVQGEQLTIPLSALLVQDADGDYPSGYSMDIKAGTGYTIGSQDGTSTVITSAPGVLGLINVGVTVSDGIATSILYNLVVNVVGATPYPPKITAQQVVKIPEDGFKEMELELLEVVDAENGKTYSYANYPTEYQLTVLRGHNYIVEGNTVMPNANFTGNIVVPVYVYNGLTVSPVYFMNVEVTPANDAPKIIGQYAVSTPEDTELQILVTDLIISDKDTSDHYPNDFAVNVLRGDNYQVLNNSSILPVSNYVGALKVNVRANDGTSQSETYELNVDVIAVNDAPVVVSQSAIQINEDTLVTLSLDQFVVTDIDSDPSDMKLVILSGDYWVKGSTVAPPINQEDQFTVAIAVSDGAAANSLSDTFNVVIGINNLNDAPLIVGQQPVSCLEETLFRPSVSNLQIEDPDSQNASAFTLEVFDGQHYTLAGGVVYPEKDFAGVLNVPVKVSDGTAYSPEYLLKLQVDNVNDAPMIIAQKDDTIWTVEDSQIVFAASQFNIQDVDNSYGFTIEVLPGTGYSVVNNTVIPAANYFGVVTVNVVANDNSGANNISPSFPVIVKLLSVEDDPVLVEVGDQIIYEDYPKDMVAKVSDPDPEGYDTVIVKSSNPNVVAIKQQAVTAEGLSYTLWPAPDSIGSVDVTVIVRDATGKEDSETYKVTIINSNDAPKLISIAPIVTTEDTVAVVTVSFEDLDKTDNHIIEVLLDHAHMKVENLSGHKSGSTFEIVPDKDWFGTGEVIVSVIDNSTAYGGSARTKQIIPVTVLPGNDTPVVTAQIDVTTQEEKSITLPVFYSDVDDLTGAQGHTIMVTPSSSNVSVTGLSGHGTGATYKLTPAKDFVGDVTITVSVTDDSGAGNSTGSTSFKLTVTNVNDKPDLGDFSFTVPEMAANGTVIGTVVGTDPIDNPADSLSYQIVGGNADGLFQISPTGELTVANGEGLDFETKNSYVITVEVKDDGVGQLSDQGKVTITLTDMNERPTFTDQSFTVAEDAQSGAKVGQVSITDIDGDAKFTYAVVGGVDMGAFAIGVNTGVLTVSGGVFDFESPKLTYTILVEATDAGGLKDTAAITVMVTDANDQPYMNTFSFTVDENSLEDDFIGTVVAEDADVAESFIYEIVGGERSGAFKIDQLTGNLTVSGVYLLDYEEKDTFVIVVKAIDEGGLAAYADVTIVLADVYENYLDADNPNVIEANNVLTPSLPTDNLWAPKDYMLYQDCKFVIYNRWGKAVYNDTGLGSNGGWDATYEGKPLQEGTYYYVVRCDADHIFTGFITVLRD